MRLLGALLHIVLQMVTHCELKTVCHHMKNNGKDTEQENAP